MQSALNAHSQRLRTLKDYFHSQERSLISARQELQQQLDRWHEDNGSNEEPFRRELSQECDQLTAEIDHARMAIAGTNDELQLHEGHLRLLASAEPEPASCNFEDFLSFDQYELLGA